MRLQELAIVAIFTGIASAGCVLKNELKDKNLKPEKDEKLCKKRDKGVATLGMSTNMIDVPTFNGGNAMAGAVTGTAFMLYDNECVPKGVYSKGSCGIPWSIHEDWLDLDIVIDKVNLVAGGARYDFAYGAGEYMTHENSGSCKDASHDLTGESHCQVPFPVNGNGDRI